MHIQIVNFNFNLKDMSVEEYKKFCDSVAQTVADLPGLISKTWLANSETNTLPRGSAMLGRPYGRTEWPGLLAASRQRDVVLLRCLACQPHAHANPQGAADAGASFQLGLLLEARRLLRLLPSSASSRKTSAIGPKDGSCAISVPMCSAIRSSTVPPGKRTGAMRTMCWAGRRRTSMKRMNAIGRRAGN